MAKRSFGPPLSTDASWKFQVEHVKDNVRHMLEDLEFEWGIEYCEWGRFAANLARGRRGIVRLT